MSDTATKNAGVTEPGVKIEANTTNEPVTKQEPTQTQEPIKKEDKELINSLKEDIKSEIMSSWDEKEKTYVNQIKGLDRKVSELTQVNKTFKEKEMTKEELFQEQQKELNDKYQQLWRDQSVVQNFHYMEPDDRNIIKTYLYGNTEDQMVESEKALFDIFDKYNKQSIEKAIEERLSSGYKPQGASDSSNPGNDFTQMTKEELAEYAIKASKMRDGEEKSSLLQKLSDEQNRRLTGG